AVPLLEGGVENVSEGDDGHFDRASLSGICPLLLNAVVWLWIQLQLRASGVETSRSVWPTTRRRVSARRTRRRKTIGLANRTVT
ncbi:MAG TPA: hypothetical protein VFM83_12505, partial [Gaiellaceae bacterium]|nr:hypothetical protein [Gaiellaceae bacterium]